MNEWEIQLLGRRRVGGEVGGGGGGGGGEEGGGGAQMDRQKQNDFSPLEQEVSNQRLPPGLSFANTKRSLG